MNNRTRGPLGTRLNGIQLRVAIVVLACGSGCTSDRDNTLDGSADPSARAMQITAVSYPLQFLTQSIVGDLVAVDCPLQNDSDSEAWQPAAQQIAAMQESDLIIVNGSAAPYAGWLSRVTLPEANLVKSANEALALSDFIVATGENMVHSHGPEGEHSHPVMVSRTWLDPKLARDQAVFIGLQLSKLYPEHAKTFEENFRTLEGRLNLLIGQLEVIADSNHARDYRVVTLDSRLKFLTRAAGLDEATFVSDGPPTAAEFRAFIEKLLTQNNGVRPIAVIWSQTPPPELLEVVEQTGLPHATIDLLDHAPASGHYLDELADSISRIATLSRLDPQ